MIQFCGCPMDFASPLRCEPTSRKTTSDRDGRLVQRHTVAAMIAAVAIQTNNCNQRKASCVTLPGANRAAAAIQKVNGPYIANTWSYSFWPETKSRNAIRK